MEADDIFLNSNKLHILLGLLVVSMADHFVIHDVVILFTREQMSPQDIPSTLLLKLMLILAVVIQMWSSQDCYSCTVCDKWFTAMTSLTLQHSREKAH